MNKRFFLIAPLLFAQSLSAEVPDVMVHAVAETAPISGDADDPAIWVHPENPEQSLVLGTDKQNGLYVYDLSGEQVAFFESGRLNNVDIRPFTLAGEHVWLASAAERETETLVFYVLRADGSITEASPFAFPGAPAEFEAQVKYIYGSAMMRDPKTGRVWALVNYKSGDIIQWEVIDNEGTISLAFARHLKVATQPEGMVSDDVTGHLYVGEEDVAIWRFPGVPEGGSEATRIASIPSDCFPEDDIEGLSIYDGTEGRYLVASSQGIHKAALFDLTQDVPPCIGMVGIKADIVDGVTETDGLDVTATPLGPRFPEGMIVMMDDQNEMFTTNFKLISWADVRMALDLK